MKNTKKVFSKRKPERNKKIKELRDKGFELKEIGKKFKISKQRVAQILNQKSTLVNT